MSAAGKRIIAGMEEALAVARGEANPAKVTFYSEHFPPSVNSMYANVPGRGRIKSESYRTFRTAFMWDVKRQHVPSIHGHYRMSVSLSWLKRRSNSDLSNRIKGLEDALVELGVVDDDSLCDSLSLAWADIGAAAVKVEIEAVE